MSWRLRKSDKTSEKEIQKQRGFLKIFTTAVIERQKNQAKKLVEDSFEEKFIKPNLAKMGNLKDPAMNKVPREEYLNLIHDIQTEVIQTATNKIVQDLNIVP